jgi:CheY-like chemotaxis protein
VLEVGADPLPVLANVGQIYQVLLNLCGNANDAFEGRPGNIVVSLAMIGAGHPDRQIFEGGGHEPDMAVAIGGGIEPDQAYAAIHVADNGGGMLQATIDRIFEPFFTTKERGHGTGLGLAVVHGIVTAYQGAYVVRSRLGAGSDFSIYLPLAQPTAVARRDRVVTPRGLESVLVIDDEVDLTDMLSIGLGRLGYDVTGCNDPVEALAAFEEDPEAWDIVITDQAMPAMKGTAVIKRLKAMRPACPVILCTGFADGATEEAALAAGADAFLLKPVEAQRIAQTLRTLLDHGAVAPVG